jgi:hypothetical protein
MLNTEDAFEDFLALPVAPAAHQREIAALDRCEQVTLAAVILVVLTPIISPIANG